MHRHSTDVLTGVSQSLHCRAISKMVYFIKEAQTMYISLLYDLISLFPGVSMLVLSAGSSGGCMRLTICQRRFRDYTLHCGVAMCLLVVFAGSSGGLVVGRCSFRAQGLPPLVVGVVDVVHFSVSVGGDVQRPLQFVFSVTVMVLRIEVRLATEHCTKPQSHVVYDQLCAMFFTPVWHWLCEPFFECCQSTSVKDLRDNYREFQALEINDLHG